jgi:hypothetical protein
METKTVNLRDLPEDLVRRAKAYAAMSGMTLKQFVINAMEKAMERDIPVSALRSSFLARRRGTQKSLRRGRRGA